MSFEDHWNRRLPGTGLLLLLFVIAALAVALHWVRPIDHRLAGSERIDLCAQLGTMPALSHLQAHSVPNTEAAGQCEWRDGGGMTQAGLTLFTTRNLAQAHNPPMRIDDYYRQRLAYVRSIPTEEFTEVGEPGQRRLRHRSLPYGQVSVRSRQWLIEDRGVLLWLYSNSLDAPTFDALAESLRVRLHGEE